MNPATVNSHVNDAFITEAAGTGAYVMARK
jgi:hypothetical protein